MDALSQQSAGTSARVILFEWDCCPLISICFEHRAAVFACPVVEWEAEGGEGVRGRGGCSRV